MRSASPLQAVLLLVLLKRRSTVMSCKLSCSALFLSFVFPLAAAPLSEDAGLVARLHQQMQLPAALRADDGRWLKADGNGGWIADLGASFLAPYDGTQIPAGLDERLQSIRLQLLLLQEQQNEAGNITFRFDGWPLEAFFPDAQPQPPSHDAHAAGGVDVFVSASHGWYLHGTGAGTWRLQRPRVNGMVEDLLTPRFAERLAVALQAHGRSSVFSRATALDAHPQAGKPWWEMASRYHARALYPDRPDIWQSYADRETPLREYNDDIRTRPLLANALGARALVHLHTNAGGPQARGAMAFYQPGRTEGRRLGHLMLCAMRESVGALPAYRDYRVRVQPLEGNYGENRLATAPSILIELGFHTHPQDAIALQDPRFQQAAAEGLRNGYLAYMAGQGSDGKPVCR